MKKNGFAPIIILVLIALAVVGYFGYKNYWPKTQTSAVNSPIPTTFNTQPIDNSQIVNSNGTLMVENQFSFKLPTGWKYNFFRSQKLLILGNDKYPPTQPVDGLSGIIYLSFEDYPSTVYENNTAFKVLSTTKVVVDGSTATKQNLESTDGPLTGTKSTIVYIDKNDLHIRLNFHTEGYLNEFDQILSTFKFTQ